MRRTTGRIIGFTLMIVALAACSSSPPGSDFEQVGAIADSPPGPSEFAGRVGKCAIDDDCAALFESNDCRVPTCTPDGKCLSLPEPDGSVCDDGNACTSGEACVSGVCAGGDNGCACEDDAGCADFQDLNLCNARLVCVGGTCELDPGTEVTCDHSGGQDCFDSLCNPDSGQCEPVTRADGAPCNDG
ncbi:MAG: hypothetical protein VX938_12250, partial [Myxococcota bacterium]|nr:hypothetical protein [Myxococcota bacterium]